MGNIGVNNPCPCGSGLKYKKCCLGSIPWDEFYKSRNVNTVPYLSARGKNLLFLETIADALQLNSTNPPKGWPQIKKACTSQAIKKIYESIPQIWIDENDLLGIYNRESKQVSGLYVGIYEPERLLKGITRHCLYSDKILLVDPFLDPRFTRPEFNPIENPLKYRTSTIRCLYFWFTLTPWIEAGLLNFIRTPGDFDTRLRYDCMMAEKHKMDSNPVFESLIKNHVNEEMESVSFEKMKQYYFLLNSDKYIADWLRKSYPDKPELELQDLMKYVSKMRDDHPFYVEPSGIGEENAEMLYWITGTNYEMAKITASLTGSHIITDIPSRWKEMEIDRSDLGIKDNEWLAFAKAFHNLDIKFLEDVPIDFALRLRQQNRLEAIRGLFRRIWKMSVLKNQLDDRNIQALADELIHHVNEAESEWKKIDQELLKWFGLELASAIPALSQMTSSGSAQFLGAGVALAGVTNLVVSWLKRGSFLKRYPAGFFLRLKSKGKN